LGDNEALSNTLTKEEQNVAPVLNDEAGISPIQFPTADPHTLKVWSREVNREVLQRTLFQKFLASEVVKEQDELTKGPGDTVYCNLEYLISGDGKSGNETLEANGVAPQFSRDSLSINQLRQAVEWYTRMDQQRVIFDFRSSAKSQLADWWADRLETAFINQVCGNTVQTNVKYTGMNATLAPTANHVLDYQSANNGDGAAACANLDIIRHMIYRAKSLRSQYGEPLIRPVMIDGGEYWPILVGTESMKKIRESTEWQTNYRSAMQGGMISDNPIFTGAAGVIDGAILYENDRVPAAANWATLAGDSASDGLSALASSGTLALLGKGAAAIAYGREGGRSEKYVWDEDSFDYGNKNGISAALIFGMKKLQFGGDSVNQANADVHDNAVIVAAVDNSKAAA
jgi:N4-gp56 family major capsid protein